MIAFPPPETQGAVFSIRTVHETFVGYDRKTRGLISCRVDQFGPDYGLVLAWVPAALPYAAFLYAADDHATPLELEGGPVGATIIPLRMGRNPDEHAMVSFASPQTGLFACAAPPLDDGQPHWVALAREERAAYEWYALEPVTAPIPLGLAEMVQGPLTGPAILSRMEKPIEPAHAPAFLAFASLLPEDQARWLASLLLVSPPALQSLQRLAPADIWAQGALPALQRSLQGGRVTAAAKIGPELDILAVAGYEGQAASFAHRCNSLARATVAPRRTLALLATARNEGLYLLEWVAYHRLIGFERIFVYSNDNDDGSDDLLRLLAKNELITWVDSEVRPGTRAQFKAYGHAFGMVPDILDYRWTLVIDLDEFMGFDTSRFRSAADYVAWQEAQHVEQIALNWLVFASGGRRDWADEPMVERFTERLPAVDMHVKSMSRTNLCIQSHAHVPVFGRANRPVVRDERGRPFQRRDNHASFNDRPTADLAWISHYFLKSAEEFAWKSSRNRGDQGVVKRLDPTMMNKGFASMFMQYHATGATVSDPRTARCAPGLRDEIRRMRALPGMEAALQEIYSRFQRGLVEIKSELASNEAFASEGDAIGMFRAALLGAPAPA